jgi:hypothetical protein
MEEQSVAKRYSAAKVALIVEGFDWVLGKEHDEEMAALEAKRFEFERALRELYDDSPNLAEGDLSERIDRLLGYAPSGEVNARK